MSKESVWDYPRPPAVQPTDRRIRVVFNDVTIVDTTEAIRVLETSHPPVYYLPPHAVLGAELRKTARRTLCEYKGVAAYVDVTVGARTARAAAWFYSDPMPGYESIRDHLAFYPKKMDQCWVDGDLVIPQHSNFYGGWITPDIEGPFKSP